MTWFFELLLNPYFSAATAGLVTFFIMYLDAKITKKETSKKTYTKNIILVMLLCGTIVYILSNTTLNPQIGKIVAAPVSPPPPTSLTAPATATATGGGGGSGGGVSYDTADILIGEPKF
jgi:hypothetical protein